MKNNAFIRTFAFLFRSDPLRVGGMFVLVLLSGVLPSLHIFISMRLINTIADSILHTADARFSLLIGMLTALAAVMLLAELVTSVQSTVTVIVTEKFSASIMTALAEKLAAVDALAFFEEKERLVKINTVKEHVLIRPQNYVFNVTLNLQKLIHIISMIAVLCAVDYLLPVFMLCSTVPVFLISQYAGKKQWAQTEALQDTKLRMATYIKHGLDGEKAKDSFLFGFVTHFNESYRTIRDSYLVQFIGVLHKGLLFQAVTGIVSAFIMMSLFFLMIFIIVKRSIAVGAVAGYIQAFMQTQYEMQDLAVYGRWYFTLMGYFTTLFEILDWQPEGRLRDTEGWPLTAADEKLVLHERIHTIALNHVWFSYTDDADSSQQTAVLKDVSLTLDGEKRYALVGKNGSGKTTLVKLLLGFYQPQQGEILINGKYRLADLDMQAYRSRLAAVFQDFALYAGYTVDENIFVKPEVSAAEQAEKRAKVRCFGAAFEQRLAQSYDTVIGKQHGGEEFSGGQQQRLAALRAFLKTSDVMFFDEPTSAIDPIAENEFIEMIFAQTAEKPALIVTHRMSSVKACDEIIVLDSGMIAETGSFHTLMEKQGLFAQLYDSQRKHFAMDEDGGVRA
ncbi:MAG: ABC transporter ATP-binding protein [Treponema sp.]